MENGAAVFGSSSEFPRDPVIPLINIHAKEMKTHIHQNLTHTHLQQHNSWPGSGNNPDIHPQMNKQDVVQSHTGILLGREKE